MRRSRKSNFPRRFFSKFWSWWKGIKICGA